MYTGFEKTLIDILPSFSCIMMSTKRKAAWIAPSFDDFGVNAGDNQKRGYQKRRTHKEVIDLIDVNNDGKKDESIPWVDKYKPTCEEELAIHKKKIQEVKSWLETETSTGQILLLTGPAGSGKSAVVHTLTNTPRYTLKEWINPLMQEYDRENRQDATARQESQSQLFHDFLLRANRYTQLNLFAKDEVDSDDGNIEDDSKKIVLVEDMPNFLLYDPTKMHNILSRYPPVKAVAERT
ncbi:cell cycle checkpoint protein RAD17-like [Clytia hemisphaerica]|uniref:cell cycle checkpoint protein RAD17-like n=1 Tax=Clytia hemisphaerica TaxID=252671 RepID=UPI0034D47BFC